MNTPMNPGPRLPDKPVRPPTIALESAAADRPSDTASVLERLKAAQPRVATGMGDDSSRVAPPGTRSTQGPAAATTASGPASEPATGSAPEPASRPATGSAPQPASARAPAWVDGLASQLRRKARPGSQGTPTIGRKKPPATAGVQRGPDTADGDVTGTVVATGSPDTDPNERFRLAAEKARLAAGVTGKALRRGSSATVRHIGSWDADVVRQTAVTICAIACILGSAAGVGALGGPSIADAAGGSFSPDATLLAPSSSAFSIWSVIYVGLVAYTVFQWLPSQRRTKRQRNLGWTVAASMLLNLAWILSAQAGQLTQSLVVIMLLLFALLAAVRTMNDYPNETRLEGALVDTPIGLYLGWVLVAAGANAAAFFTARGTDLFGWQGTSWAVAGIVVILMTAAVICSTDRGRLAVAAATSWGLLWIAVERVLGQPFTLGVAFTAALAIFLLLITAGSRRHRVDHEYRRWLRAHEDAQREPLDLLGDHYEDSRY
jgi:tryptophan-rich sensory protein